MTVGEGGPPPKGVLGNPDVQVPAWHITPSLPSSSNGVSTATLWLPQRSLSGKVVTASGEVPCWGERLVKLTGELAVAEFTRHQRRRNLSPATISHRRFRLVALSQWLDKDLLDATAEDIEKYLDIGNLAPQTRRTYLSYFRAFYTWAQRERLVKTDPTEHIIPPKLPRRVPRPIPQDELAYAVAEADPRMRCFLLLAAFAGARCMEISGLLVEDIHRDRGLLLLRGKGDKERLVPLHDDVYRALITFGLPRTGAVFRTSKGTPLKPSTISRYVGSYLRSVGVDATAHRGRHSYATRVYQLSNGDLRMTQDLLGHASPSSTAIYAAWSPDRATQVVDQLRLD